MKKYLIAVVLAILAFIAIASPFLREPGEPVDDESELVFIDMPAGRQIEQTEGKKIISKMVRTGAAWSQEGDPIARGGVLSEFPDAKGDEVHTAFRGMVYFCKSKAALQTSFAAYGAENKIIVERPATAIPLLIAPGSMAEKEIEFMCEGLAKKACTAKACV